LLLTLTEKLWRQFEFSAYNFTNPFRRENTMPEEPKRPLKVFLCHAHADRNAVRRLYARLTKDGVDVWLDKEKLLGGVDWELEIHKAVREADVVAVCLSKQFNQEGFRQKEVRLALDAAMEKPEGEIFIIPVRLEECESPESLRKWQWVDLFENGGYKRLMRSLKVREYINSMEVVYEKSLKLVQNVMDEDMLIVDPKANLEFIRKQFIEKTFVLL
jgi:TIR domain-containing protein